MHWRSSMFKRLPVATSRALKLAISSALARHTCAHSWVFEVHVAVQWQIDRTHGSRVSTSERVTLHAHGSGIAAARCRRDRPERLRTCHFFGIIVPSSRTNTWPLSVLIPNRWRSTLPLS